MTAAVGDPAGHRTPRVVVVGGGITGLSTAYYLMAGAQARGQDLDCILIEGDPRLGGKVQTEQVGDLTLEQGPDSFLNRKPWARELSTELGLGPQLVGTNAAARKTYILHGGRLEPLPEGMAFGLPSRLGPMLRTRLLSWPGKVRAGLEAILPPGPATDDESLGGFLRRRIGREATERLAEPLLAGIYAGDIWDMSLMATFPQFREMEQSYGSLTAAIRRSPGANTGPSHSPGPGASPGASPGRPFTGSIFATLRGGLHTLIAALASALSGRVRLLTGVRVERLTPGPGRDGRYRLDLADGSTLTADAVAVTVPAGPAARLLDGVTAAAGAILADIPSASVATVALAYPGGPGAGYLDGSGFLVPRGEGRLMTACTWVSSKWPHCSPAGDLLVRCYVGRAGSDVALRLDGAEILDTVAGELRSIMGLQAVPYLTRVYRWPQSMPQYRVGHPQRMARLDDELAACPGLAVAGAAYGGVGLPDCIRQGQQAAERLLQGLTGAPRTGSE